MKVATKKEEKRVSILKAASEVFARYGYDKTTLEDIGKRLGMNKASLYYYFKNKEEIFIQVILAEMKIFINDLQKKTASKPTVEEKTIHYLTERIKRYEQVLNVTKLSIESLRKVEPLFQDLYSKVKQQEIIFLQSLLNKGVEKQEIIATDTKDLAESLFIISDALKHDRVVQKELYFGDEFDYSIIEKKITNIIKLIFNGLKFK